MNMNHMEQLASCINNLYIFLGSISVNFTEEDFVELEKMGFNVNREMIIEGIERFKNK